ncbi:DUF917 family protein [Lichenihabitans psoromatis]|uniref:S-methyl thiohydantoin desulfurase domain-containing protein n=1 Tax=Lichenihabitans psoromatis TaxID=2528642 RepID=UPI0010357474|nr:DUF917 family protein [Lichenihabitans psoromatis]
MRRNLTRVDVKPAMIGGLLLSAGGSGVERSLERHDLAADVALGLGPVAFVSLDELPQDGIILASTSVGAPGHAQPELVLRDHVDAAQAVIARMGAKPCGIICGHVPGFNAWLVAAALGIPLVDAAANGRGHPTVKMGGMGLASRPEVSIVQAAKCGYAESGTRLAIVAEGNLIRTSQVMRHAAIVGGGLVASARGPYSVGFVAKNGAVGAISYQMDLGRAMLAKEPGYARVAAAAKFMGGETLITGTVTENSVGYRDGFDVGRLVVSDETSQLTIGVFNEFMTADQDDKRVATFPDMIGSLDPTSGDPIAIAQLHPGSVVSIVAAHHTGFPLGKGALDPALFVEVEEALGLDIRSYLPAATALKP